MKFDSNLSALHGYLCGDGYVIRNPESQKHKYYHIGFRNTNEILLNDFRKRFEILFGLKPHITKEGRCRIQNKEIYNLLTKNFSYYSYEWQLPTLSKQNLKHWLRAFFDCEGWVENQIAKSRLIGLECCNKTGITDIQKALLKLNIESKISKKKGRTIWRLTICDKSNLIKFRKQIGFLHPNKNNKLTEAINSYVDHNWIIPSNKKDLFLFVKEVGKPYHKRNIIRFNSIKLNNLEKLKKALNNYQINSTLFGPWTSGTGSKYYCLTIKKEDFNHERNKIRTSSRNQTS